MKKNVIAAIGMFVSIFTALCCFSFWDAAQAVPKNGKILIAYFSHTGNTRFVASQIREATRGDMFEIRGVKPYASEFDATVDEARAELENGTRPALAARVENMEEYDVVFLGFPNWVGTMPMVLFTFLDEHDLKGKTIVPFCTHGTGGLGNSVSDLAKYSHGASVREALSVYRQDVRSSKERIATWLQNLGYMD